MDINPTAWLTFDFTDDQWSGLVRFSGELPKSARTEFKPCISLYLLRGGGTPDHEIEHRDRRERLRRKILDVFE